MSWPAFSVLLVMVFSLTLAMRAADNPTPTTTAAPSMRTAVVPPGAQHKKAWFTLAPH
jgi:hypothetical protein